MYNNDKNKSNYQGLGAGNPTEQKQRFGARRKTTTAPSALPSGSTRTGTGSHHGREKLLLPSLRPVSDGQRAGFFRLRG